MCVCVYVNIYLQGQKGSDKVGPVGAQGPRGGMGFTGPIGMPGRPGIAGTEGHMGIPGSHGACVCLSICLSVCLSAYTGFAYFEC